MEEKDKRKVKNSSSKTVGFLNTCHHGRTKSGVLWKEENVQLFKPLRGFLIQQMTAFPFFLCPQHKIIPQFSFIHPPVLEHSKVCKQDGKSSVSQDESTQKTMEVNVMQPSLWGWIQPISVFPLLVPWVFKQHFLISKH